MTIKLTIAPMYSGKTTKMMSKAITLKRNGKKFIVICHPLCTKKDIIISHNGEKINCITTFDVDLSQYDYILVDEVQFFEDIVEKLMKIKDKKIYLYGLDTDFQRKPFPTICGLLSICSKIKKINGTCRKCGGKSAFTERIDKGNKELVSIGDDYIPVCLNCHIR